MYFLLENGMSTAGGSMLSEYARHVPGGVLVITCTKGAMGSGQSSVFIPGTAIVEDKDGKHVLVIPRQEKKTEKAKKETKNKN